MFASGLLWSRVQAVTDRALESGALQPIATDFQLLEDAGTRFMVRIVSNLARKNQSAHAARRRGFNPFLPYDPQLYVADISETHVGVLNKFNVVDHHLLIVTREFEHQQTRLNSNDFFALARALVEYPSLGFYNSGKLAGASQPHKHLQLIPLPLSDGTTEVALSPFDDLSTESEVCGPTRRLPFAHAAARLDARIWQDPSQAAIALKDRYSRLLESLRIVLPQDRDTRVPSAYNLLVTQAWMLVVPRRQECFAGISLNAMAFAGALLVRDAEQLEALRQSGPMAALQHAAGTEVQ